LVTCKVSAATLAALDKRAARDGVGRARRWTVILTRALA
jgi:hypothetical protein